MIDLTYLQALPNQQTVDYPSFKLVIVGDGGTGIPAFFRPPHLMLRFSRSLSLIVSSLPSLVIREDYLREEASHRRIREEI